MKTFLSSADREMPRAKPCRLVRVRLAGTLLMSALFALTAGCLSPRYQHASKKNTPQAVSLNRDFPPAQLQSRLNTLIVSGGPGSWKKEAFWDEYVVTLHNSGAQPLQVTSAELMDFNGVPRQPGNDPWKLERESKSLARRYRDAGVTVVRIAAPRLLVTTAEPSVAAAAGIGGAGAAATTATAVALPIYGATVLGINLHNKKSIAAEFSRRRLPLPVVIAPGEARTGSLFFPMVPNPRSLIVHSSSETDGGQDHGAVRVDDSVLPLDFLQGLHVKGASGKE